MNTITHKVSTQRTATASAKLICNENTLFAIKNNSLPKGEPFGICKAAGLLAAKQTPYLLPHCHPIFIDGLTIEFHLSDSEIGKEYFSNNEFGVFIKGFAKCIGKTGIEMEVLTAVSIAALTLYDLLKPLGSKDLLINEIKLLEKTGGKSQLKLAKEELRKAVILNILDKPTTKVSDSIKEFLNKNNVEVVSIVRVDKLEKLENVINQQVKSEIPLIFTVGKTSAHHKLNLVLNHLIDTKIEGAVHAMYHHGYQRSPESIDSNLIAGFIKNSLLITLPGSTNGSLECLDAVLSSVFLPLMKKRLK